MRVLVAGGTGFIGRPFVDGLAETEGLELMVLSRSSRRSDRAAVKHVSSEWAEAHAHPEVLDFAPQMVVNMIGSTHPRSSVGHEASEIAENVLPFFRLIDALEPHGLAQIVFCSSAGSIYHSALDPTEKAKADSPYVATKRSIELYLSARTSGSALSAVSLRISYPVGSIDRPGFGIVNHFSRAVAQNENVEFVGDHAVAKDYVDLEDVTDALRAVVLGDWEASGHVILDIGSGWAIDAKGMHALIVDLSTSEDRDRWASVAPNERGMQRDRLAIDATRKRTGWAPQRNILQSIRSVFEGNLVRNASCP